MPAPKASGSHGSNRPGAKSASAHAASASPKPRSEWLQRPGTARAGRRPAAAPSGQDVARSFLDSLMRGPRPALRLPGYATRDGDRGQRLGAFGAHFRPGVAQADGTVENQMAR